MSLIAAETSWSCLQANISSLNTCCALLIFATCIRAHFQQVVSLHVKKIWAPTAEYSAFLIQLIEFVLAFQLVHFEGQTWQVTKGLRTGLQTSVVLARLYLASFDEFIVRRCPTMMCWRRYIDDAFAIVRTCDACVMHTSTSLVFLATRTEFSKL